MSTAAPLQNTAAKSPPVSNLSRSGLLLQRKCACGSPKSSLTGECEKCKGKTRLQTKLSIGASNDPLEQEADRVADQVLAAPAHSAFSGAAPRIQRYTGQSTAEAGYAPPSVDRVLAGSGRPLDPALQQDMGQRFGHDFSRVRVHTGTAAQQSARDVNAHAYTVGHNIVFATQQFAPSTYKGRRLIAHELTHVVQQSGTVGSGVTQSNEQCGTPPVIRAAASLHTVFRDEAPAAVLPTQEQRDRIMEIFNPQQSAGETEAVDDPVAFRNELLAIGDTLSTTGLTAAQAVSSASVVLSQTDLTDVTAIAEEEVRRAVGPALSAGANLTAVRNSIQYIPADPGTAPAAGEATLTAEQLTGLDRSAARIKISQSSAAQQSITNHHVQPGGRDRDLYNNTIRAIVDRAPAAWRSIALTFRGWNMSSGTLLQRRVVSESGEPDEQARRRGRWMNLGTSIHEMLHAVTHHDFITAIRALEKADLGVEGFTEFFTRRIYADVAARAASNAGFRLRIEGTAGPAFTPPQRGSYTDFFNSVTTIFHILNDNIENMQQAYFNGRVEFLGLGSWNTLAHGLPARRGNLIGGAVLFESAGGSIVPGRALVRASYGRLVWGTSGSVQVDLRVGGGVTYMSEGQRLGIGPEATLTLRGAHLFLEGGALLEGSVAASGPATPRLDALLHITAGAQIGRLQVGPTLQVLIPVTDRDAAERGTRVFVGLGASFVFGQ